MSGGFIEEGLSGEAVDLHRALASLQEELEAIDFYHQRADRSPDGELKALLIHNRDDELEHAAMLLEWVRRILPPFDAQLRRFLFVAGPIRDHAAGAGGTATPVRSAGRGLGLGNLR